MKITVIYGTDTARARERYIQIIKAIRKRGWDVVSVVADKKSIAEKLSNPSLFGNQLFSIENAAQLDDKSLEWLAKYGKQLDANLLIFHAGAIPKKTQVFLKEHARLESFELPKIIWQFLDSIYPCNSKVSILLFHKLLKHEPVELIFAILSGQFRDLFWAANSPESLNVNSWRKTKLVAQAKKFDSAKLQLMLEKLSAIDIVIKTQSSDLAMLLDLFLARELK